MSKPTVLLSGDVFEKQMQRLEHVFNFDVPEKMALAWYAELKSRVDDCHFKLFTDCLIEDCRRFPSLADYYDWILKRKEG